MKKEEKNKYNKNYFLTLSLLLTIVIASFIILPLATYSAPSPTPSCATIPGCTFVANCMNGTNSMAPSMCMGSAPTNICCCMGTPTPTPCSAYPAPACGAICGTAGEGFAGQVCVSVGGAPCMCKTACMSGLASCSDGYCALGTGTCVSMGGTCACFSPTPTPCSMCGTCNLGDVQCSGTDRKGCVRDPATNMCTFTNQIENCAAVAGGTCMNDATGCMATCATPTPCDMCGTCNLGDVQCSGTDRKGCVRDPATNMCAFTNQIENCAAVAGGTCMNDATGCMATCATPTPCDMC